MFKAIGFLIVLWGLSNVFSTAFPALDSAARQTFETVETAAVVTQVELQKKL